MYFLNSPKMDKKLFILGIVTLVCISTMNAAKLSSRIANKEDWYPSYHLAPKSGWMNDPNGLIYYNGYYHAFYQYNPTAPVPGLISWGHAYSKNMLDWVHLPIAIEPTIDDDSNGCFSGSAVNDNGILSLLYTGNSNITNHPRQVQCLATSTDGIKFSKVGRVLDAPADVSDFRDPKAWRHGDKWYLILGTKNNNIGEVQTYKSDNLRTWEFDAVIARAGKDLGYMWECPDLFQLENKHILVISPQGMKPKDYDYRNLYQSGYFVGTWQPGKPYNIEKNFREIDHGHDFYAPQTFLTPDNRRILIAWLDIWEAKFPENKQGWSGMLSLPRELTLTKEGKLLSNPVREIKQLRETEVVMNQTRLKDEHLQLETSVKAMEVELRWNLQESNAEKYGVRLGYSGFGEGGVYIYVDNQSKRLILDRRYPALGVSGYRSVALPNDEILSLRIFFDHSSVEVFVKNGEATLSSRIYPENNQRYLTLFSDNGDAVLEGSSRWVLKINR